MIDVIFFLLVFFMLFTTFKTTPHGIDLQLPKATTVTQTQPQNFTVNITQDGQIFVEEKLMTINDLKNRVQLELASNPKTVIILKADERAKYKSLIQVMDAVSQVGGSNFALAADKAKESDQ